MNHVGAIWPLNEEGLFLASTRTSITRWGVVVQLHANEAC